MSLIIIPIEKLTASTRSSASSNAEIVTAAISDLPSVQRIARIAYECLESYEILEIRSYADSEKGIFYSSFSYDKYYEVTGKPQATSLFKEIQKVIKEKGKKFRESEPELTNGFIIVKRLQLL